MRGCLGDWAPRTIIGSIMATDPFKKKNPGSRSWQSLSRSRAYIGPRDESGDHLAGEKHVGIEFVCCGEVAGAMAMYTTPDPDGLHDRSVYFRANADNTLPLDSERSEDSWKVLLLCDSCGKDVQISRKKAEAMLNAIWKPDTQHVVSMRLEHLY